MKYVKQAYAGWIGVMNDTHCTSGVCTFVLDNARREQLIPVKPTKHELVTLYRDYCERVADDPHGFKAYIERGILNA